MAETIWWCEFHRAGGDPELDCWGAGLDGQDDCDMVERELIDPADLDYEAAKVPYLDTLAMFASKMLRITHEEAMEREDIKEAARLVARASVDAALGVGKTAEGSE